MIISSNSLNVGPPQRRLWTNALCSLSINESTKNTGLLWIVIVIQILLSKLHRQGHKKLKQKIMGRGGYSGNPHGFGLLKYLALTNSCSAFLFPPPIKSGLCNFIVYYWVLRNQQISLKLKLTNQLSSLYKSIFGVCWIGLLHHSINTRICVSVSTRHFLWNMLVFNNLWHIFENLRNFLQKWPKLTHAGLLHQDVLAGSVWLPKSEQGVCGSTWCFWQLTCKLDSRTFANWNHSLIAPFQPSPLNRFGRKIPFAKKPPSNKSSKHQSQAQHRSFSCNDPSGSVHRRWLLASAARFKLFPSARLLLQMPRN